MGLFAHQLARLSGAYVVGTARQARNEALVRQEEHITGPFMSLLRRDMVTFDHVRERDI